MLQKIYWKILHCVNFTGTFECLLSLLLSPSTRCLNSQRGQIIYKLVNLELAFDHRGDWYNKTGIIVICIKKQTKLWVGHFMTISGHFLANYINIFHKIELQTIILMCLNMLKSYLDQKLQHETQLFSFPIFCNFVKKYLKFMTHKLPSWEHFWPFFWTTSWKSFTK